MAFARRYRIIRRIIYAYVYKYKYIIFCKMRGKFYPAFCSIKISLVLIFKYEQRVSLYVRVLAVEFDCVSKAVTGGSLRQENSLKISEEETKAILSIFMKQPSGTREPQMQQLKLDLDPLTLE